MVNNLFDKFSHFFISCHIGEQIARRVWGWLFFQLCDFITNIQNLY